MTLSRDQRHRAWARASQHRLRNDDRYKGENARRPLEPADTARIRALNVRARRVFQGK